MLNRLFMPSISLSAAVELIGENSHSDHTAKWYRIAVNNFIGYAGDVRVRSVCVEKIRHWSSSLDNQVSQRTGNPLSPTTKNNYRRAIRGFFNHLADMGYIRESENPVSNFRFSTPVSTEARHLKPHEAEALLQVTKSDVRDHAIMYVLYATGCRRSELCSMRLSTLTFEKVSRDDLTSDESLLVELARDSGVCHLIKDDYLYRLRGRAVVEGKGRDGRPKTRVLFLDDCCAQAVKAYLEVRPRFSDDRVFLSNLTPPNGKRWEGLKPQSINSLFKKYSGIADIHATPHMLRHTFAKRLIDNGANAKIVQRLMGHEDITTTLGIYYNFSDDELFNVYEQYGKRGSK